MIIESKKVQSNPQQHPLAGTPHIQPTQTMQVVCVALLSGFQHRIRTCCLNQHLAHAVKPIAKPIESQSLKTTFGTYSEDWTDYIHCRIVPVPRSLMS